MLTIPHNIRMTSALVMVGLLFGLTHTRPAHAATLTVSDCSASSGAPGRLREVIGVAGAGDTVVFSCSGTITLADTLGIGKDLTLDGAGQSVTISGGNDVRVFDVSAITTFNLQNLTVANGFANSNGGGGVRNLGFLNVTNATFSDNAAEGNAGGGIVNSGELTVTNSVFTSNSTTSAGGGIYNNGKLTVTNSAFSGNHGVNGGGIANWYPGTAMVTNSVFSGNGADGGGGGVFTWSATTTLTNNAFSGNTAAYGGGVYAWNGATVHITNSTFSGNSASTGGGIYGVSTITVTNSTLSGNSATEGGGAIEASVTVRNTIIANSVSSRNCLINTNSALTDGGGNLQFGGTIADSCGATIPTADPVLGALADNGGPTQTMALGAGSAALEAANYATCMAAVGSPNYGAGGLDQRGQSRASASSLCDIGAFEGSASLPDDLIIDLATSQEVLNALNSVVGSLLMINVDGREYLVVPNATSVGLDVTLTDNDRLLVIDLNALASAGGEITIAGNLSLQSVDLSSLTTVGGSLTIANNPALNAILISGVTSIGGDLAIVGTAATVIDVSALATVTGSLVISDNTSATTVDVSSVTDVGGDVTITGNTAATAIDVAGLATVGGDLDLSGNTSLPVVDVAGLATVGGDLIIDGASSATDIDLGSATSVGGDVIITDNTAATALDVGSLATAGGDLDLSGNSSLGSVDVSGVTSVGGNLIISGSAAAASIDVSGLASVSGDLTIVDNGSATVDVSADVDVGGDVTIETTGTGTISVGGDVTGDLTLDTSGYTAITGATPGGDIDLTSENLEALMHLQIQAASFTTPVAFSVTRVEPAALPPESGAAVGGSPATVDPIAAYQFTFAVPTLNRDATISFDIDLAQLDAATQSALLAALAAGTATMGTKGDAPGSAFQAFPLCAGGVEPTAGGCVRVETFDALGEPTGGPPARVRFSNVVGHFSTWAVAIVTPASGNGICSILGTPALPDIHFFEFNGTKGERVTITLAPNPAGSFTPGKAALAIVGFGLVRLDATALPNSITATLPRTGTYYSTVSERLWGKGLFAGAYCVSLKSSRNASQTFRKR